MEYNSYSEFKTICKQIDIGKQSIHSALVMANHIADRSFAQGNDTQAYKWCRIYDDLVRRFKYGK